MDTIYITVHDTIYIAMTDTISAELSRSAVDGLLTALGLIGISVCIFVALTRG